MQNGPSIVEQAQKELIETTEKNEHFEKPVTIQEIAIIGNPGGTGEYIKGQSHNDSDHQYAKERLFETIKQFVTMAANEHKIHCRGDEPQRMQEGQENHITRLVTNEFLFYTRNPLELDEFKALMEQIHALAKEQPENLHLVLSSFAIKMRNDDNGKQGVLNVVPYVECGPNPQMSFIVKNTPSELDPTYSESGLDLLNWGSDGDNIYELPFSSIKVGEQDCPFSYYNIVKCKTAGDTEFYTGVNICLDHKRLIAQDNFNDIETNARDTQDLLPIQRWLIITSNWVNSRTSYCWDKTTYVDRKGEKQFEPNCSGPTLIDPGSPLKSMQEQVFSFPNSEHEQVYLKKSYNPDQCEVSDDLKEHNSNVIKRKESDVDDAKEEAREEAERLKSEEPKKSIPNSTLSKPTIKNEMRLEQSQTDKKEKHIKRSQTNKDGFNPSDSKRQKEKSVKRSRTNKKGFNPSVSKPQKEKPAKHSQTNNKGSDQSNSVLFDYTRRRRETPLLTDGMKKDVSDEEMAKSAFGRKRPHNK